MGKSQKTAVPLNADTARRDVNRARFLHRPVSPANPYAHVPVWVPFFIARPLAKLLRPSPPVRR